MSTTDFALGIPGYHFSDLYRPSKLKSLHEAFWQQVEKDSADLRARFDALPSHPSTPEHSQILIDVATKVGEFIAKVLLVQNSAAQRKTQILDQQPIFKFKREFLNTRVFKRLGEPPLPQDELKALDLFVQRVLSHDRSPHAHDLELRIATTVLFLQACEKTLKAGNLDTASQQRVSTLCTHVQGESLYARISLALRAFEDWCVQMHGIDDKNSKIRQWVTFIRPNKLEFDRLVHTVQEDASVPERHALPQSALRLRDGFRWTDSLPSFKNHLKEIDYCIYCHQRDKDSCSKGFKEKDGTYKKNPLNIPLKGCPLDERISEMHFLYKQGDVIASLAMIMLDNPMCPGTGHRICNDCMKSCIFQKQDPVNIPLNETSVLNEVLEMPHGVEIYNLLTRFNPLNRARPFALPYNGKNVLVVGLGPSGYTLVHYLANEGFGVVGIDALKLEPIDSTLTGMGRNMPKPIKKWGDLKKELDERVLAGFGGVSEYGITVRWDKNFLGLMYLSLARRSNVRFYGGVRFGGTLEVHDAWALGFDHVALATGAGKPTIIGMKNNLLRGIRKASDFLMALQLTGAFKRDSLSNLQVKLPAIVIGGGLTGIDTATELLAYYPVQVEKALERFEAMSRELGENAVWDTCDEEERETLKTFLEHGRAIREERKRAGQERRSPNLQKLCREWGGVSLVYRKRLIDSPAYRLNHEEVHKALEEGITLVENLSPLEAIPDQYGAVEKMVFKREDGSTIPLPAKTVCVAAGTHPNTTYEKEWPGTFELDPKSGYFKRHRVDPETRKLVPAGAGEAGAFFSSYDHDGRRVSFYGDNHPDYAGNVVKAMASAKHGAPHVAALFKDAIGAAETGAGGELSRLESLFQNLDRSLCPRVVRVNRLTPTIVEVIVRGKYVANKFQPGQFYRLQNFETSAHSIAGSKMVMEGIALTGAWVEPEQDLLSLIVLEMGASSRLCCTLHPEDPVVVMGPTGAPSEIPKGETVLLAGGGLGNAVLFSISRALKENGNRVLYFAGYRKPDDIFKQKELEEATDQMVWSVDSGAAIPTRRPQDLSFVGNIVQSIHAYASGKLVSEPLIPLQSVDRILAIGSDRMMQAITEARKGVLAPYLKESHYGLASINSPMQCMMKEICAQCLQRHRDPKTGEETIVFTCFNQDQEMDKVDFAHLRARLKMNSLAEKLSNKYVDYLFQKGTIERV